MNEDQEQAAMKALLQCAASDLDALSPAMYEGYRQDCQRVYDALITADRAQRQAEPVPAFQVGSLVTLNPEDYPGMGEWFVQLWAGESVVARVYGNSREELNARIAALNAAPPPAQVPEGFKLVPLEPTALMRKAACDAWLDHGSKMYLNKAMAAVKAGISAAPDYPS